MNKFKKLRRRTEIKTAKKAAKLLGVSASMMYAIENGSRMPSRKLAVRMCKVYDCTLNDIFLLKNTT